jgi:hypothetical protein
MLFTTKDLQCPKLEPIKKKKSKSLLSKEQQALTFLTEAEIEDGLQKSLDIHYVSKGILSTHQIVERIVNVVGSSSLLFATWAIT